MRILVVIVMLTALCGCGNDEIVLYKLGCDKPVVDGECKSTIVSISPDNYKIFPDQQRVVTWVEGFAPTALSECAVRDKKNWSCRFADDSARFLMVNGRMVTWINPDLKINLPFYPVESASGEFQTSWIVWRLVRMGFDYKNPLIQLLKAVTV